MADAVAVAVGQRADDLVEDDLRAGTVCFIPRGTYRITAPLLVASSYGIESSLRIESDWATIRASAQHGGSQPLPAPAAMESVVNVTMGTGRNRSSCSSSSLCIFYKRKQALAQTTGSGQTCNGKN